MTGRRRVTGARGRATSGTRALLRNELRLLRRDPVPAAILVGMPLVLMVLLSRAVGGALLLEGKFVPGSSQTVPGMACVFAGFGVAIAGFAFFREHGWRTWRRLRAAGLDGRSIAVAKLGVPAGLLIGQHVVLFAFGALFLDFVPAGPWIALAFVGAAFVVVVLAGALAAVALLSTVQQLNAVTNLATMALGGLGGGFVPVAVLPEWIQPIAPISPVYWAMLAYRRIVFEGGGIGDVLAPVAVLLAFAVALCGVAAWRLRLDEPKRTWG